MEPIPIVIHDIFRHALSVARKDGLISSIEWDFATAYLDKMQTEEPPQCKPLVGPPILRLI
jgi:hypothetical protein